MVQKRGRQRLDRGKLGDVARHRQGRVAQFARDQRQPPLVPIREDDFAALGNQPARNCPPDPACPARNDGDLADEEAHSPRSATRRSAVT